MVDDIEDLAALEQHLVLEKMPPHFISFPGYVGFWILPFLLVWELGCGVYQLSEEAVGRMLREMFAE